tara:strand:- start:1244 stop:1432 length:189 start_codon:yes stop_codon:yes gene_type:complete
MNSLQNLFKAVSKNENLLKGYASRKCKNCYGRGYIELSEKSSTPEKYMCECVAKNIKKEYKK